ncbi:unnamed protein product [Peniophora sp. CBMAI 1063]|nr:unnamed protein product [Peniophora sp. CBMAI 1063]
MAIPRPINDSTFNNILLRTSTPAPDEKVLMYLEGMRGSGDGSTLLSPHTGHQQLPRSQLSGTSYRPEEQYADEYAEDEISSDVQEQPQSTLGSHAGREPGPEEEPGPHYPSLGASSFGHRGPIPGSSTVESTPKKAAGVPLPNSTLAQSTTKVRSSRAGSRASASQLAASAMKAGTTAAEERPMSPKAPTNLSRAMSPARPGSKNTHRSEKQSTAYPPLPESVTESLAGNRSRRAYSKAPSLSPSDSPSNFKPPRPQRIQKEATLPPVPASASGASDAEAASRVRSHRTGEVRSQAGAGASAIQSAVSGGGRSQRPQSPPRTAPIEQDLMHAVMTGQRSVVNGSVASSRREPRAASNVTSSRVQSPDEMNTAEQEMVQNILLGRPAMSTNRTSYAATSVIEPNHLAHYHDAQLCILLHKLEDENEQEIVRKAVRKAVKERVKKLGMKFDNETIRDFRKSYHDHDPSIHLQPLYPQQSQMPPIQENPEWVHTLLAQMQSLQEQVAVLSPKIDGLLNSPPGSQRNYESEAYAQTPITQTIHIQSNQTGTESVFAPATEVVVETELGHPEEEEYEEEEEEAGTEVAPETAPQSVTQTRGVSEYTAHRDSPGQQYLEEELYKLRVKPSGSQSAITHKTWELARDDGEDEEYDDEEDDAHVAVTESGMPEIPDSQGGYTRPTSPPAPSESHREAPQPAENHGWHSDYTNESNQPPPWQRIHQRLLNWAIVWPLSELDNAYNSTQRGNQVDEVALSIWSTQTYKRYVRSKMTDAPPGRVDRLFVPPNMADAISNAVFNGRHGDASGMLRDLWHPFGLDNMPRLLIVLARHRSDANHWVVHRFSLPDGTLTTYDSYPERCLPDGRPLGWWFAIRIAWPHATYPSPDNLMQKMVRLHRPMQLGIDNSVAAAGIWRNLLMGSRAERNLDLARLRDLISTETANLRQRKQLGKLTIGAPRPNWEDMN